MKAISYIVLLLTLVLGACAQRGVNKGDFNLISMDQERAMGQQVDQEIRKEMRVRDDAVATVYLAELGRRLMAGSEEGRKYKFMFHVVDDPAVNAFAVPGGHVYVNKGLIRSASNESELAGVLGHEMAHVIARHGTEQLTKAYGLEIVSSLALGNNPGMLQQLAAQVGGTAILLKYGRDAESEADKLGVRSTYSAGIDPRGLVRFFSKLAKGEKAPPEYLAWLSTHPLTTDRIKNVQAQIAQLPPKPVVEDSQAFHQWKNAVIGPVATSHGARAP